MSVSQEFFGAPVIADGLRDLLALVYAVTVRVGPVTSGAVARARS